MINESPLNILIWGGNFINKGAEAMVRTVQRQLRQRLGESTTFCVEASDLEAAEAQLDGSTILPRNRESYLQPWDRLFKRRRLATQMQLDDRLKKVDAVVNVSGYSFGGPGASRRTWRFLAVSQRMARAGKPVMIMPQAWGPFLSEPDRKAARKLLKSADVFYARDRQSQRYLQEIVGGSEVPLAPDIALLLEPAVSNSNALIGLPDDRPIIAIAPNMRVYDKSAGKGADNQYIRSLCLIANHLLEQTDAHLLLVPHEMRFEGDPIGDDCGLCRMIESSLSHRSDRVTALLDVRPAEQIKEAIGRAGLLIGSRFHALIAAVSQHVPVVALGWSHKYQELLSDVGLTDRAVEFSEASNEALIYLVDTAWAQRQADRQTLEQTIPGLKCRAEAVFDNLEHQLTGSKAIARSLE